mmetsp:Transcript_13573/g.22410  ORF Transcript_13573/g.22410 Transcript_13573/m.22410 type:complete len:224 (-) Transcript_13573:43-714(-)
MCSAVTAEAHEGVAAIHSTVAGAELGGTLSLLQETTSLASCSGEASQLTVLHHGLADPVDARVVADDSVEGIHHDHLVPLVNGILCHPVRVQHTQAATLASHALLCDAAKVPHGLPLVDTLIGGLAVDNALSHTLLAISALHAHAIDAVALLGLVAHLPSLVRTGGFAASVHRWQLAELPVAQARQESHDVGLLLAPHLLKVLVCAHASEYDFFELSTAAFSS